MHNRLSLNLYIIFYSLVFIPFLLAAGETRPILLVIGTRPEAIKVIPVYEALKQSNLPVLFCSTGQHNELVNDIFSLFHIKADFDFNIMKTHQDLSYVTEIVLNKTTALLKSINPCLVVVQGDTTSAMTAALAAYYCKIPVAHIEAGLRTNNIYGPFPEEINRQIIARIASLHFSPTPLASSHLKAEGIPAEKIFETGNTGVDALYMVKKGIEQKEMLVSKNIYDIVNGLKKQNQTIFLFTFHRRESLQSGMEEAMTAIYHYLKDHPSVTFIYPIHPNPLISAVLKKTKLTSLNNLILLPPLQYIDLVYLLLQSKGVLTDSGGIQEEAISLHKPTLTLRNQTDRPEGARVVGTNPALIEQGIDDILLGLYDDENNSIPSPFGDGFASQRISEIIQQFLYKDLSSL